MRIFLIAAMTADGYIGRHAEHFVDWSTAEDKQLFTTLTKEAGVMVMGSRTFKTIGRALPGRRNIVLTSQPDAITTEGIEPTNETPAQLVARLESEGVQSLAVCGGAAVYAQFAAAGLVTELYLTIEPLLFGSGVPLFTSELDIKLQLADVSKLNDNTVLLHYTVVK